MTAMPAQPLEDVDTGLITPTKSMRRVARSSAWFSIGFAVGTGASLVVSIIAGRALGPAGFGEFSYYTWLIRAVGTVLSVGVPAMLSRFVAEALGASDSARLRDTTRLAARVVALTAAVGVAFVGVYVLWKEGSGPLAILMATAAGYTIAGLALEGLIGGARRFRVLTKVAVWTGLAQLTMALTAQLAGLSWRGFLTLQLLAAALPVGMLVVHASRIVGPHRSVAPAGGAAVPALRFAGVMAIVAVSSEFVWGRPELFFLDRWWGSVDVGIYSVALRLATVVVILPSLAPRVLIPEFSWLVGSGNLDALRSTYRNACRYTALIGVPIAVGGAALADIIVPALFGATYEAAVPIASIVLLGGLAGGLASPVIAVVLSVRRPGVVAALVAGVAATNIGLDLLLVSRWGALGAALATVASQVAGVSITLVYAMRSRGLSYPFGDVAKLLAAGAVCAGAVRIVVDKAPDGVRLILALAVGAVAYAGTVLATRAFTLGEMRALVRRPSTGATR
jgi:O-antigen/teichoic acid export membrane protein